MHVLCLIFAVLEVREGAGSMQGDQGDTAHLVTQVLGPDQIANVL